MDPANLADSLCLGDCRVLYSLFPAADSAFRYAAAARQISLSEARHLPRGYHCNFLNRHTFQSFRNCFTI